MHRIVSLQRAPEVRGCEGAEVQRLFELKHRSEGRVRDIGKSVCATSAPSYTVETQVTVIHVAPYLSATSTRLRTTPPTTLVVILLLARTPSRRIHLLKRGVFRGTPETEQMLVPELADEEREIVGRLWVSVCRAA